MPYVTTDNSKIYYTVRGKGAPVVFLHGNNEDGTIYDKFAPNFYDESKVYAFDSPYHGKSVSGSEISYLSFAKELAAAFQKLELQKPALIGYSDGGIIGLLIASNSLYELSGLITLGANFSPDGLKKSCIKAIKAELSVIDGVKKSIAELMLNEPYISKKQLAKIAVPSLIIAGERDLVKTSHTRRLADSVKGAEMFIVPGAGHFVIKHDNCVQTIKKFLRKRIYLINNGKIM